MGTRGYSIIHFRGRYHLFYSGRDSYPDGLGDSIVCEIPTNPREYATWLAGKCKKALKWDKAVQKALCIPHERRASADIECWNRDIRYSGDEALPYYMPAMNDLSIQWVYVLDLDREVFTVDHGAHFELKDIPLNYWKSSLAQDEYGNRLLLPNLVPQSSIASLEIVPVLADDCLLDAYKNLSVKIVTPRGIRGFPPDRRHGPLFHARLFQIFQRSHKIPLACLLRGWTPDELQYREIAHVILCLASGSQHTSLELEEDLQEHTYNRFAQLQPSGTDELGSEFIAAMGTGCHLEGNPTGSAPDMNIYWFGNALICLAARLDCPGVVEGNIVSLVRYRCRLSIQKPVDAVLISIEHVLLVKISDDGVECTELLPLFNFRVYPSMDPTARYSSLELAEIDREQGSQEDEDAESLYDAAQEFETAIDDFSV